MRFSGALLSFLLSACTRPQPELAAPDPSTKPLAPVSAAPAPAPTPSEVSGQQACEPIVRCGVWSGCVWLSRIDATRYRALGGADKGSIFVRRHECWSSDAGTTCAVHCTGADGGAPCVDGLHPEDEVCTGAAVPTPDSTRCLIGAGICGSLM